jgi:phage gpG-like protein
MARAAALELNANLPGLATTTTRLTRLSASVADWTPFWNFYFSPLFYKREQEIFASSGGGGGTKTWAALSPMYAKWKARHVPGGGILIASGDLKASLTRPFSAGSVYQASAQSLMIGSSLPYARAHFTGTGPQSKGPKSLPKRREMRIPWQFLAATSPILKKWIRDNATKDPIPGIDVTVAPGDAS